MYEAAAIPSLPTVDEVHREPTARHAVGLLPCLMISLLIAACGGSSQHTPSASTASPAQMSTRAESADAGGVRAALAAVQLAIRKRDVTGMCSSLLPATATQARGSAQAIDAAITAQVRDCEAGFGRRGEFAGYAPLGSATVTRIEKRGRLATIELNSTHGPASVRFLYLGGRWRMLVTNS